MQRKSRVLIRLIDGICDHGVIPLLFFGFVSKLTSRWTTNATLQRIISELSILKHSKGVMNKNENLGKFCVLLGVCIGKDTKEGLYLRND
jgi:hypothetical protein